MKLRIVRRKLTYPLLLLMLMIVVLLAAGALVIAAPTAVVVVDDFKRPVFSKTATADSSQSGCLCTRPLDLATQRADRQKSVTTGGLSTKTSAI